MRGDVRHGFNRVEGDIGVELAVGPYDLLLLWALGGSNTGADPTWFTPAAATTVSLTSVDITDPLAKTALFTRGDAGNFIDDFYRPGDIVDITGFVANTINTGRWRIFAVTATTVTIGTGTTTLVAEATVGVITYAGSKATIYHSANGSKLKTFTLEREFADATNPVYEVFRGCAINTLNVSMRPESMITATFGILGMSADVDQTATVDAGGGYTPAATNPPLAGVDAQSYVGKYQQSATAFDVTIDNQRTLFGILGSKYSPGVFEGVAKVTGTISKLMTGPDVHQQFQDETSISWAVKIDELGTTNFLTFSFYKVKTLAADMDPPTNGPVIVDMPFEALEQTFTGASTTYREVMHIQRST